MLEFPWGLLRIRVTVGLFLWVIPNVSRYTHSSAVSAFFNCYLSNSERKEVWTLLSFTQCFTSRGPRFQLGMQCEDLPAVRVFFIEFMGIYGLFMG